MGLSFGALDVDELAEPFAIGVPTLINGQFPAILATSAYASVHLSFA